MVKEIIICKYCKKEFSPRREGEKPKYCSRPCYLEDNKKWRTCIKCGKKFYGGWGKQKYCSKKCWYANSVVRKKGKVVKCLWCGKDVYKMPSRVKKYNFCSPVHYRLYLVSPRNKTISKGWKHTKEAIEKISEAGMGRKMTKDNLRKLIKSNKERVWTEELREKMRQSRLNKKQPEHVKEKIRKNAKYGKDNHAYKGGITKLSARVRDLPEYGKWRDAVFKRDDYTCQICGARSGGGKAVFLHPHHIISFSAIMEKYEIKSIKQAISCKALWDIDNGKTLCRECHEDTDNFAGKALTT